KRTSSDLLTFEDFILVTPEMGLSRVTQLHIQLYMRWFEVLITAALALLLVMLIPP
ncbi:hypothetical protein L9F63_006603, partial [Diploptera punctata]